MKNNYITLLYIEKSDGLNIEILSNISNIIIAFLTLALGFYVFVYQKNKDKKKIKLQWFKEIILQPKIDFVFNFYNQINSIESKIHTSNFTDDEKNEIINFVKKEEDTFRKSFLNLIQHIYRDLHSELSKNIDKLTNELIDVVSSDKIELNDKSTYNKKIQSKIEYSYGEFLSKIFNYSG